MKKMPKGRLTLSSEKVRTLNNPKLLTPDQLGNVGGGATPTFCCRGCDCSSWGCVG